MKSTAVNKMSSEQQHRKQKNKCSKSKIKEAIREGWDSHRHNKTENAGAGEGKEDDTGRQPAQSSCGRAERNFKCLLLTKANMHTKSPLNTKTCGRKTKA